jgi:hypothetical protein
VRTEPDLTPRAHAGFQFRASWHSTEQVVEQASIDAAVSTGLCPDVAMSGFVAARSVLQFVLYMHQTLQAFKSTVFFDSKLDHVLND